MKDFLPNNFKELGSRWKDPLEPFCPECDGWTSMKEGSLPMCKTCCNTGLSPIPISEILLDSSPK